MTLHICNCNFEWELSGNVSSSLTQLLEWGIGKELQFLPCLYARQEDGIVVTKQDLPTFVRLFPSFSHKMYSPHELSFDHYTRVESWGYSQTIAAWAKARRLTYLTPSWKVTHLVNSKVFSFTHSPKLASATILQCKEEAEQWFPTQKGCIVLKNCFGVSGTGHLIQKVPDLEQAMTFMQKEWIQTRVVIAEPWVERLLDFSTQWFISPDHEISYLGATLLKNNTYGRYQGTRAGDEKTLFGQNSHFIEKHRVIAHEVLQKISQLGYFGNVGIDAMLYHNRGEIALHPIVEINARKTMGWVVLTMQKRYFPQQILALNFSPKNGFTFHDE